MWQSHWLKPLRWSAAQNYPLLLSNCNPCCALIITDIILLLKNSNTVTKVLMLWLSSTGHWSPPVHVTATHTTCQLSVSHLQMTFPRQTCIMGQHVMSFCTFFLFIVVWNSAINVQTICCEPAVNFWVWEICFKGATCLSTFIIGGGDSSVVRAPDSWLKGRGFESLLEWRENFLLQGRLSVLTLISVSIPAPCYRSST